MNPLDRRALFMGEEITDIYHYGKILARPLKEPILALELAETETFAGGVTAAAQIARGFCEVEVLSTASVVKERFIEKSHVRKLFEVYRDYKIKDAWEGIADGFDLIAVLDYGHGMFDSAMVKHIEGLRAPFLAVNVQSNAGNYGFNLATKWSHVDYLCMDEAEARLATQNRNGRIESSLEALSRISPRVVVTLGVKGAIGLDEKGFSYSQAFTDRVVDTLGAGDAFFAVTACFADSVAMSDLLTLGNTAGALKAQSVGHRDPITREDILAYPSR